MYLNSPIGGQFLVDSSLWWASLVAQLVKNSGRPGFNPWVGKIPWRKERLPTPVFCPGEFHGLYNPWGRKELDRTERLSLSLCCDGYPSTNKLCEQVQGWLKELPGGGISGSFRSRAISASVENIQLLSRVVQAIHLPTGNVQEFLFLHILATVWCYQMRQCLQTAGCEVGCRHVFAFPWWLVRTSLSSSLYGLLGSLACELPIPVLCPFFYRVI